MKHSIATIIFCLLMSNTVLADSVEMADLMRSNGKIYIVIIPQSEAKSKRME